MAARLPVTRARVNPAGLGAARGSGAVPSLDREVGVKGLGAVGLDADLVPDFYRSV